MESVYEREFLSKPADCKLPGFSQRPINRLATTKQPSSILSIETNHLKRNFDKNPKQVAPLLEYRLWLEAGKLDKASFKSSKSDPDVSFNSNLWRNFRASSGLVSSRKDLVTETVATLYPINVPAPSQVGQNTLAKFYQENKHNMFKTDKTYEVALTKVDKEASMMKYLSLKTEMRNPPLDWKGNILPPKNFKTYPPIQNSTMLDSVKSDENGILYPHLLIRSAYTVPNYTKNHLNPNDQTNHQRKSLPTKLVYRQNHPNFDKVILEQQIKGIYKNKILHRN